jgi:hypothetical protein
MRCLRKMRRTKYVWISEEVGVRIYLWLKALPDQGGYEDVNHPSDPVDEGSGEVDVAEELDCPGAENKNPI